MSPEAETDQLPERSEAKRPRTSWALASMPVVALAVVLAARFVLLEVTDAPARLRGWVPRVERPLETFEPRVPAPLESLLRPDSEQLKTGWAVAIEGWSTAAARLQSAVARLPDAAVVVEPARLLAVPLRPASGSASTADCEKVANLAAYVRAAAPLLAKTSLSEALRKLRPLETTVGTEDVDGVLDSRALIDGLPLAVERYVEVLMAARRPLALDRIDDPCGRAAVAAASAAAGTWDAPVDLVEIRRLCVELEYARRSLAFAQALRLLAGGERSGAGSWRHARAEVARFLLEARRVLAVPAAARPREVVEAGVFDELREAMATVELGGFREGLADRMDRLASAWKDVRRRSGPDPGEPGRGDRVLERVLGDPSLATDARAVGDGLASFHRLGEGLVRCVGAIERIQRADRRLAPFDVPMAARGFARLARELPGDPDVAAWAVVAHAAASAFADRQPAVTASRSLDATATLLVIWVAAIGVLLAVVAPWRRASCRDWARCAGGAVAATALGLLTAYFIDRSWVGEILRFPTAHHAAGRALQAWTLRVGWVASWALALGMSGCVLHAESEPGSVRDRLRALLYLNALLVAAVCAVSALGFELAVGGDSAEARDLAAALSRNTAGFHVVALFAKYVPTVLLLRGSGGDATPPTPFSKGASALLLQALAIVSPLISSALAAWIQ